MPDVLAERVHGVEIVLGKRKGSGRRAGPGIDESRLDHAITFGGPPDVTPAVFHNDVHVGPVVQTVAPVACHAAHDVAEYAEVHAFRGKSDNGQRSFWNSAHRVNVAQ